MKRFLLLFVLAFPSFVFGQILKERRVYYLDCSYSMISPNKIWDKVCENLKNAIDNVTDETSELMVIPFTDRRDGHYPLPVYREFATENGKANLKKHISSLQCDIHCNTIHNVPLTDFYDNRVDSAKVTYMFFMTDGQNEGEISEFQNNLKSWGKKFGGENVYGFYVMLHNSAKDSDVERIISAQPHLWKVESADVNVNLIRFQNHVVFNVRNDRYIDIPFYGELKDETFEITFPSTSPYRTKSIERIGNKLRVFIDIDGDLYKIPETENINVFVSMNGADVYDFLVTDVIEVKCENKFERSLKVTIQ